MRTNNDLIVLLFLLTKTNPKAPRYLSYLWSKRIPLWIDIVMKTKHAVFSWELKCEKKLMNSTDFHKHKHLVKQKTKQKIHWSMRRKHRHKHMHKQKTTSISCGRTKANSKGNSFCFVFVSLRGKFILCYYVYAYVASKNQALTQIN